MKRWKMKNEKNFFTYRLFFCILNFIALLTIFFIQNQYYFLISNISRWLSVIHFVCTINTNIYYLFHKINHISWKIIEAKKLDFYFLTLSMFWQEYRKKKVINVFDTISIISILLARTYDLFHLFRLIAA